MLPARAFPVPFCLKSFLVLPLTIARVLDAAVPARLDASWDLTPIGACDTMICAALLRPVRDRVTVDVTSPTALEIQLP